MNTNQSQDECVIKPMTKGELAIEQRCSVELIRRRFIKLGIDTGYDKFLIMDHLEAYYKVYGKTRLIKNAG